MRSLVKFGAIFSAVIALAGPGQALNLSLPGAAELTVEQDESEARYAIPTGPLADGVLPTEVLEGRVIRQAWRIDGAGLSTLNVTASIREQLRGMAYELRLDCAAEECGGFEFRYGTQVLPGPEMFVDLFDYRFLTARNAAATGEEHLSVLVSRAGGAIYVQLIVVGDDGNSGASVKGTQTQTQTQAETTPEPETPQPSEPAKPLVDALLQDGHVVLSDLEFRSGSSDLSEGPYPSLETLAEYLKANKARRVALVGHTDSTGSLDGNIRLSRARAGSVLDRLVNRYKVPKAQIESNGMGYLSPVAPNTTEAGREANRRVEAVLLAVE